MLITIVHYITLSLYLFAHQNASFKVKQANFLPFTINGATVSKCQSIFYNYKDCSANKDANMLVIWRSHKHEETIIHGGMLEFK